MRTYETMLVLDPEMSKEQVEEFVDKLKKFLGDRGVEILKVEEWGARPLAYEIKKKKKGLYLLFYLKGDAALISEMERSLRLMEEVLRYLTVKREEGDIETSQQQQEPEQEEKPEEEKGAEEETAEEEKKTAEDEKSDAAAEAK
jgi:small subunit ribosomal protein S6